MAAPTRSPRLTLRGKPSVDAGRVLIGTDLGGMRVDIEIRPWLARQKARRGHISDLDLLVTVELVKREATDGKDPVG